MVDRKRFFIDESFMCPTELEEAYNKLPVFYKDTLVLRDGEIEIGGFKQFLAYYGDKRLKFKREQKGRAEDAFILMFFDNRFMVDKIAALTDTLKKLNNVEEYGVSETNYTQSIRNNNESSSASTNSTNNTYEDSTTSKDLAVSSDGNSSGFIQIEDKGGEVGDMKFPQCDQSSAYSLKKIKYPVNTVAGSGRETKSSNTVKNTSMDSSTSKSSSDNTTVSANRYQNKAKNLESYLHTQLPELRRQFGYKFSKLFLF